MSINRDTITYVLLYVCYGILVLGSLNHIFFWDTVQLGAKHGLYFYENNFTSWILPDEFDSGHIPIFGAYLALVWKVCGKSLWISHLAMLPWVIGIVYQTIRLIRMYTKQHWQVIAMMLVLMDPTLLAQCTLISPDVILIYGFIHLWVVIIEQRYDFVKFLLCLLLATISMRGAMILMAMYMYDLWLLHFTKLWSIKKAVQKLIPYALGGFVFIAYMYYHYSIKGWIGFHIESPWAPSFERVGLSGLVYNIAIYTWRVVDMGRMIWIIAAAYIVYRYRSYGRREIWVFLLFISAALGYSFLSYRGLQAHRYLLPVYIAISIYVLTMIDTLTIGKIKYFAIAIFVFLFTGHRWIYPQSISKGWDSYLAYVPYMDLLNQAEKYIRDEHIDITQVSSFFPNIASQKYLKLNDDPRAHPPINLLHDTYVLSSNIYNDLKEDQLQLLTNNYNIKKHWQNSGVEIILWKKK
jgi:hypothetical protein